MSTDQHSDETERYLQELKDENTLCLEVYGTEFVAIVWEDQDHGLIANMRFGSGRHHTAVDIELEKMLSRNPIRGVNVVSMDKAREVTQ